MKKQTHKMNTEICDFVMNGQTAHIHVCFCQCPFSPENLKTNSCFSHPPDTEHIKRMKARRAGWNPEKDAHNSWVLWGSLMLYDLYKIDQCIEEIQCTEGILRGDFARLVRVDAAEFDDGCCLIYARNE